MQKTKFVTEQRGQILQTGPQWDNKYEKTPLNTLVHGQYERKVPLNAKTRCIYEAKC